MQEYRVAYLVDSQCIIINNCFIVFSQNTPSSSMPISMSKPNLSRNDMGAYLSYDWVIGGRHFVKDATNSL